MLNIVRYIWQELATVKLIIPILPRSLCLVWGVRESSTGFGAGSSLGLISLSLGGINFLGGGGIETGRMRGRERGLAHCLCNQFPQEVNMFAAIIPWQLGNWDEATPLPPPRMRHCKLPSLPPKNEASPGSPPSQDGALKPLFTNSFHCMVESTFFPERELSFLWMCPLYPAWNISPLCGRVHLSLNESTSLFPVLAWTSQSLLHSLDDAISLWMRLPLHGRNYLSMDETTSPWMRL